jgi:hypothetical protein
MKIEHLLEESGTPSIYDEHKAIGAQVKQLLRDNNLIAGTPMGIPSFNKKGTRYVIEITAAKKAKMDEEEFALYLKRAQVQLHRFFLKLSKDYPGLTVNGEPFNEHTSDLKFKQPRRYAGEPSFELHFFIPIVGDLAAVERVFRLQWDYYNVTGGSYKTDVVHVYTLANAEQLEVLAALAKKIEKRFVPAQDWRDVVATNEAGLRAVVKATSATIEKVAPLLDLPSVVVQTSDARLDTALVAGMCGIVCSRQVWLAAGPARSWPHPRLARTECGPRAEHVPK